ncbi:hypothetical protein JTB14_035072 [Gonioctena quinquepunctata]|nr:hypothetical protein JTB14_035072 [Gonioctena quinquepunctata]
MLRIIVLAAIFTISMAKPGYLGLGNEHGLGNYAASVAVSAPSLTATSTQSRVDIPSPAVALSVGVVPIATPGIAVTVPAHPSGGYYGSGLGRTNYGSYVGYGYGVGGGLGH